METDWHVATKTGIQLPGLEYLVLLVFRGSFKGSLRATPLRDPFGG